MTLAVSDALKTAAEKLRHAKMLNLASSDSATNTLVIDQTVTLSDHASQQMKSFGDKDLTGVNYVILNNLENNF